MEVFFCHPGSSGWLTVEIKVCMMTILLRHLHKLFINVLGRGFFLEQRWVNVSLLVIPAGPCRFGGTQRHMQNVLRDSVESSDDEFFDARGEYTFFVLPSSFFPPISQVTKLLRGWTDNIVLIRQNIHRFFYPGFVNGPKFTGVWWGAGVDEWAALNWVWHQKQQDTSTDLLGSDPGPSQLRWCMRLQWECSCSQFLMKAMSVQVTDGQLLRPVS